MLCSQKAEIFSKARPSRQNAGAFDSGSPGDGNIQTVIFLGSPTEAALTVIGHAADHENPQLTVLTPDVELGPNSSQTSTFHF